MAATIRVTSKHLGFMVALSVRYKVRFDRVERRWWWIKPRYETLIPINDEMGSANDYWMRCGIIHIAAKKRCFKFVMEVYNGKDYVRL